MGRCGGSVAVLRYVTMPAACVVDSNRGRVVSCRALCLLRYTCLNPDHTPCLASTPAMHSTCSEKGAGAGAGADAGAWTGTGMSCCGQRGGGAEGGEVLA